MMVMNLQVIGSKIELGGLTSLLALYVLKTPEMHTYPWHKYYSDSYNKIKFHPGKLKIHTPLHSQLQPMCGNQYLTTLIKVHSHLMLGENLGGILSGTQC
jgi:hypothetical protein